MSLKRYGKYIEVLPVIYGPFPDGHRVRIKVEHQSFIVGPEVHDGVFETKKEALWYRRMLAKALDKME